MLELTISKALHDKMRYAQALLSHAVPSGSTVEVLERAFDALIEQCEKRKFGSSEQPRQEATPGPISSPAGVRHIPASVRRAVWKRDGGRCTFVSASGLRCASRTLLEFDHVVPLARGGLSTVDNLRMLCRDHNDDAAKLVFGARYMREKKEQARQAAAIVRAEAREARANARRRK